MCVCVSPDSSELKLDDMKKLGYSRTLKIVYIQQLPNSLVSGWNPWEWIAGRWVLDKIPLDLLVITGEQQRHAHAVGISTALTELTVTR